jgi:ADP-ribose pyrophosphatase YjhB (NUDIX family)
MKIRNCSRALIVNKESKILLQRFEFSKINGNKILWVTPGGGLKDNESYEDALERELYEELGIKIKIYETPVLILDVPIYGEKETFISHEVYYLIGFRENMDISLNNMTNNEKNTFKGLKWWSKEELYCLNPNDYAPGDIQNYI